MDQLGGSDIAGAGRMQTWDQQTQNVVGMAAGFDPQLMMLRQDTRDKISVYLGRIPMAARCREKLPDLVMLLEEVLFRTYPNKSDYHNMTKEPIIEQHIMFALPILGAQRQQVQQNQQSSWKIASFGGYGTMTLTHGITQGASENSRMSYVPYNMGPSFGAGFLPRSANMGTSLSGIGPGEARDAHVNTELSLGMYPTHHSSRVSNNNPVIKMGDASETNLTLSMATPTPPVNVKEVPKEAKFSCPVCLHDMVDTSSTICGHIFCHECIRASIKAQRKCPTCRRKLTMRNFHRVHLPTMD